jgi:hypothetical protein
MIGQKDLSLVETEEISGENHPTFSRSRSCALS